ncbi:compound eye opsin BCRH2 isoform X3 [Eurytemora carolleeae]|uniref:compound eye opsin BCRH2 isoform X3 n=1 Tax=Eurytemora carolleeae TaxID=1294199 RepID=UPI000C784ABB|nr:compound eye opsin BCRH2 isoform X3 [Eurytemora carolleeae]|eukprot:XP_023334325.1 compound eye opsin BCRH2-like isoform X3 [Eurytemora affinis]
MSWKPREGVYLDSNYGLVYPEGATHYDGIPKDLNEIFHPHWGTFPPQHPMVNHVVGFAYIILWLISFFGNGCVVYIFLKTKSLRTPTNMFIVNLAVSDLCMMTTQGPPVTINAFIQRYWMFGVTGCKVYALTGGIFGTISILSMVVIGYDRYNVICKGFNGVKITAGKAFGLILFMWLYSTAVCLPPFFGWGGYATEGTLITCSYDYLTQDWNHKTFMLYAFIFNYCTPMVLVISFYTQIVKAVVMHEAALKAQAKKMNVESLRSGEQEGDSAEVKIAKVAITNVMLWVCIWSPYAIVVMIGCFGNMQLVTPMVAALPSFLAKTASCLNPLVYAISHPKYREAMGKELPCLGIGAAGAQKSDAASTVAVKA